MGPGQKPLWNTNNHLPPSSCPHICAPQQTQQPLPHNKKNPKILEQFFTQTSMYSVSNKTACKYCFPHKVSSVEKDVFSIQPIATEA